MIVAVCADKASPGVSTTAVALAMAWPGRALLLEADTSGGDLVFWGRRGGHGSAAAGEGDLLAAEPSVLTLAAAARSGMAAALPRYAQPTRWGIDVIAAPPAAQAFTPMRPLWDGVADHAAGWPGPVVVDLGRFHAAAPTMPLARAATAVLVVTPFTVEGLYHVRERVGELLGALGDPARRRHPVGVVVRTSRRQAGAAEEQITAMLAAAGSPVPVAGSVWDDADAAAAVRAGRASRHERGGRRSRRGGDLATSAARLVETIGRLWPDLATTTPHPEPGPGPHPGPHPVPAREAAR